MNVKRLWRYSIIFTFGRLTGKKPSYEEQGYQDSTCR